MTYESDRVWTDSYLDEIKSILGKHLIGPAPDEEDRHRNTDLIVLKMEAVRIGCRIRRAEKYLDTYGDEFTIRSERDYGETELAKIITGWGNYFFYGFAYQDDTNLCKWTLADLNVFRLWYNRQLFSGNKPGIKKTNGDNSSRFLAFKWDQLPKEFIKAKLWPVDTEQEVFAWME